MAEPRMRMRQKGQQFPKDDCKCHTSFPWSGLWLEERGGLVKMGWDGFTVMDSTRDDKRMDGAFTVREGLR